MPRKSPSIEHQSVLNPERDHGFWHRRKKFAPALEAAFQAEMDRMRKRRIQRTGLIALALYGSFAISDLVMLPDVYQHAWAIRFFLVMPVMFIGTFGLYKIHRALWREGVLSLILITAGLSLPWIAGLSHHPNAAHYHTGITLIILYGNIVLNLRFRTAAISTAVLVMGFGLSLAVLNTVPPEVRFNNWLVCFSAAVISLIANFRTDQDQRRAYLARSHEQARNAELSHAVELLGKLSAEDALTQIPNRREFDRRLELEWGRAKREGQPVALILLDVDCFKAYNDHYGHPAGDACLRGIAATLSSVLRRSSDLVARFGGEEFVALLPATYMEEAVDLAERMRAAIRELQLPHAYSSAATIVTASFGVCAMQPIGDELPSILLAEADAALYRAKQGGRDRVVADMAQRREEAVIDTDSQ